ncbi:UPF0193 protein EVG1 [Periophthalmus magnuspinnatus]|uniref:UPF0193 protein EVG1 n=1 Tax=Periophthalmus magnuspinnatus TaxID=409849 RepID=UPI002436C218|nr:UPF0193 protein EVG1 [Periophthalmus magnuspinnatus]
MNNPKTSGGLWSCARPHTYSQKTQELLKLMMQESYLANGQKRQIRECLKNGLPLHMVCASNPPPPPPQSKPTQPTSRRLPNKPQKRSADQCKAGDSYVREKFRPGPTRDHEKEKRRLQKILEMGKDEPKVTIKQQPPIAEAPEQKDRSHEILEEIEERCQFLEDMASLGQEQQYVNVINTEISQRIRELELLNKSSSETSERG